MPDRPDSLGFVRRSLGPGIDLFLQPSARFKRVAVGVFVEQPLEQALASQAALLSRVLRRGTETYPETLALEQVQADLYGAELETGVFKIGERHVLAVSIDFPAQKYVRDPGLYQRALDLLAEAVMRPAREEGLLRPGYVEEEARQLIRQIRSLVDRKPAYARWRCVEEMCRDEPYGVYSLGAVDVIETLTPARLTAYHQELLDRRPISVYAFGDFDGEELAALVAERFAFRRADPPSQLPATIIDGRRIERARQVDEQLDMAQGWLVLGYRTGVHRASADYYAMLVCNSIFGGSAHSRLFLQVRERAGLAYAASSTYDPDKGILLAIAGIDPGRRAEAERIIEEHRAQLAAGEISDDELAAAKAGIVTQLRQREDDAGQMILAHLHGRIGGRLDATEQAVAQVEQVTREQVAAVARRLILDTVYFLRPRA